MRSRFRWPLSMLIAASLLTASLSAIGRVQTARRIDGGVLWDYLAPSEVVLHCINYPAAVATVLLSGCHTFQIGMEYSTGSFFVYLACTGVLWFCVGVVIETWQSPPLGRVWRFAVSVSLLLYASFLLFFAVYRPSMYSLLFVLAAIIWSTAIAALALKLRASGRQVARS
jgi:hypothetical protein